MSEKSTAAKSCNPKQSLHKSGVNYLVFAWVVIFSSLLALRFKFTSIAVSAIQVVIHRTENGLRDESEAEKLAWKQTRSSEQRTKNKTNWRHTNKCRVCAMPLQMKCERLLCVFFHSSSSSTRLPLFYLFFRFCFIRSCFFVCVS